MATPKLSHPCQKKAKYQALLARKGAKSMIVKTKGGKYRVVSHTTGKNLGTYSSQKGAEKRLAQVRYFKHKKA